MPVADVYTYLYEKYDAEELKTPQAPGMTLTDRPVSTPEVSCKPFMKILRAGSSTTMMSKPRGAPWLGSVLYHG